ASPDPNIAYFIFRKTENDGNYVLLNKSPLSGTTYSDSTAAIGVNEYAVLAGSLVQNRSGIHYSVSNSIYSNVTFVVNGISHSTSKDYIDIAPNPSGSQASLLLNTSWSGRVQVSIVTLSGKEVHSFTVLNVGGLIKLPETPTGIYFVRTRSLENGKSAVRKWIVN
ncbi:MAG TPA: T9SS type A sorting domain-containing protein, partial [Chitinophagales bacterium]|nr:T9SS type A sorting domain-containing protein [Chitinophagales bacterium]